MKSGTSCSPLYKFRHKFWLARWDISINISTVRTVNDVGPKRRQKQQQQMLDGGNRVIAAGFARPLQNRWRKIWTLVNEQTDGETDW